MKKKTIKILLKVLYFFIFIGVPLIGYQLYQTNKESQNVELRLREGIIRGLQEELAESIIKNSAVVVGMGIDLTELIKNFNED